MSSDLAPFGPPATNPVAVEPSWPSLTFDQIDTEKTEIEMVLVYRQIPRECCSVETESDSGSGIRILFQDLGLIRIFFSRFESGIRQ